MAITAITPVTGSALVSGDSVAFTLDDTYTSLVIKVQTSTALVNAYSTALGGGQSGYSVAVVDNGDGTHTVTFTSDAGWDIHPQLIYVVEDETGTEATTNLSYTITGEAPHPEGTYPYNPINSTAVASFNGRTGAVVPTAGDYDDFYYTEAEVDAAVATALPLSGGEMSGNITMAGSETVDGRDVSADGAATDANTARAPLSGAGAPGVTTGDGKALGHIYVDTTADEHHVLVDATVGANVWEATGGGGVGSGDVVGPSGGTVDGELAVYDDTTGKLIRKPNVAVTEAAVIANTAKTTNQTHTGDVSGATTLTIGAKKVTAAMMEDGTDGELFTWDAAGVLAKVAVGTAGQVLTSGGAGVAPTMQDNKARRYMHFGGRMNLAVTGTWYGSNARGFNDALTDWNSAAGTGADPSSVAMPWFNSPLATEALTLTSIYCQLETTLATLTGDLRVYKVTVTDDSSAYTMTQIGSTIDLSTPISASKIYIIEESGLSVSITKSDKIMVFGKSATNGTQIYFNIDLTFTVD